MHRVDKAQHKKLNAQLNKNYGSSWEIVLRVCIETSPNPLEEIARAKRACNSTCKFAKMVVDILIRQQIISLPMRLLLRSRMFFISTFASIFDPQFAWSSAIMFQMPKHPSSSSIDTKSIIIIIHFRTLKTISRLLCHHVTRNLCKHSARNCTAQCERFILDN